MSVANLSIGAQFKPRNGSLVTWAEIALLAGIVVAVVAFGGTETTSFSLVEILYAGIAIILLLGWRSNIDWPDGKALAVPALLIGMAVLQLCPIPMSWSRVLGNRGDAARFGTISIEPYATRVQLLILITCVLAFWIAYVMRISN